MKRTNHRQAERALPIQDFRYLAFLADERLKVFSMQAELIHSETDRFDRIGVLDGMALLFVLLDEQSPEFEFFVLFGSRFGIHQGFYEGESFPVGLILFDDSWFHGSIRWLRHRPCHTLSCFALGFRFGVMHLRPVVRCGGGLDGRCPLLLEICGRRMHRS